MEPRSEAAESQPVELSLGGTAPPPTGALVAVLVRLGAVAAAADEVEAALLDRWGEPHRRYHDLRHLAEMLAAVDRLATHARWPDLVRAAAWWHDAVHRGRPGTDEDASAELAERQLGELGLDRGAVTEVGRLVRLTKDHRPSSGDTDGEVLCDADLAILAAPAARYAQYARDVRAEYPQVPEPAFRTGRAAVLRELLERDRLYRTSTAVNWATTARHNLAAELGELTATDER